MSSLHLVTGYAGKEHVTSADQGSFHANLLLNGSYVLNVGNKFAATIVSNNSIKIQDGDILMQGRYIKLDSGTFIDVNIENGTQDHKRNDLIVVRYTKSASTGVESTELVVIKGTPDTAEAVDPEYTNADILDGALVCDMPLYRVSIDGLNVSAVVPLFEVVDSLGARLDAIIKGTFKLGNAEKLDGHEAEYFATAERVDNIQTSTKTTFSTAGWYRVAQYKTSGGGLIGVTGNACTLTIKKPYDTRGTEEYLLRFRAAYQSQEFAIVDAKLHGAQCITKARYTYDDTYGYIEIYFNVSTSNRIFIEVTNPQDADSVWKVIEPTLTNETVDGVTVTTTYDIPANATPITTANKPIGSYTGNGSSTERTVATGGTGKVLYVYNSNGFAFVSAVGAIVFYRDGTTSRYFDSSAVYWTEGAGLHLITTDKVLNGNGVATVYQVL